MRFKDYLRVVNSIERAIYGLAQPFNDIYLNETETGLKVEKTHKSAVFFDDVVGLTFDHRFGQVAGTTDDNLYLQVTDDGFYFKLVPNSPLGMSLWKKVKRNALRHCSLSYLPLAKRQNRGDARKIMRAFRAAGQGDSVQVEDYQKILIYEICLLNWPANELTFCTIDAQDPRLKGVSFRNDESIPLNHRIPPEEQRSLFRKNVQLTKDSERLIQDMKDFQKHLRRL